MSKLRVGFTLVEMLERSEVEIQLSPNLVSVMGRARCFRYGVEGANLRDTYVICSIAPHTIHSPPTHVSHSRLYTLVRSRQLCIDST